MTHRGERAKLCAAPDRCVPAINDNADKTLASMQRIADVMDKQHAQLWIIHDKAQRDTLEIAPNFYE
jgi:N-acyl homoserine lactone hydrolase